MNLMLLGLLYLRLGVGPGFATGSESVDGVRAHRSGVDVSSELAIGYALRPTLAIGGGTYPMVVPGLGFHTSATGPFVDWRASARLHAQAAVLFVAGFHEAEDAHDAAIGFGVGAMIGAGWDVVRRARWRLGPLVRVTYYHWSGGDFTLDAVSPSVLVAFTYG
jgi:hypothetical protein